MKSIHNQEYNKCKDCGGMYRPTFLHGLIFCQPCSSKRTIKRLKNVITDKFVSGVMRKYDSNDKNDSTSSNWYLSSKW